MCCVYSNTYVLMIADCMMVSLTFITLLFFCTAHAQKITDEEAAWGWFMEYSELASAIANKGSKISWNYVTNITDYNQNEEVTLNYTEL